MKHKASAKVLLLDNNNYALVLRRSESHPHRALQLDLPGGIIEEGENLTDGIVRELYEETKIKVFPDELVKLDDYTQEYEKDGATTRRTLFAIRFKQGRPDVEISWEHKEYQWLPITDLTTIEHPVQEQIARVLKENKLAAI